MMVLVIWIVMQVISNQYITIMLESRFTHGRFFRVGCMVLLIHDVSDVLMEAAKMCKYCGAETASTVLFVVFMISWFTARLVYFPYSIIRSTLYALVPPPLPVEKM